MYQEKNQEEPASGLQEVGNNGQECHCGLGLCSLISLYCHSALAEEVVLIPKQIFVL